MFAELLPDAKTVGILFCSSEANSRFQVNVVKGELEKAGVKVTEYSFADSNDLAQVVTKACDEVDALYIPTDNTCATNTELINSITEPAKKPVIAGEESICKGCGIAALSISYDKIGYLTGLMAYDILVNGKNPAEMEIQYDQDFAYKYVPSRCEALGVTVSEAYSAIEG